MYKVVGVKSFNYNEKRNFAGLNISGFQFKKVLDLYRIIGYLYFKIVKRPHSRWLNLFNNFNLGNQHLYHFWNSISVNNKPWIVTFEYYLPRGGRNFLVEKADKKYIEFGIKRLSHSSCKQIIAISEFARSSQIDFLQRNGYEVNQILSKTVVVRPSQKLYLESFEQKLISREKIKLVMVGADFFRKGGEEIVNAFEIISGRYKNFELTIISSLQFGDYVSFSDKNDQIKLLERIQKNPSIKYYRNLPNDQVIEIFKKSHVGLLPSYEETYGYSVLEAQACGCPVITTNGTAFPEINNNECGWIVNLPVNEYKRTKPENKEHKMILAEILTDGIIRALEEIGSNPEIIKIKGHNALERIKQFHSEKNTIEKLSVIYKNALL